MEVEGTDLGLLQQREKTESPNKLLILILVVLVILVFGLCFALIALGLTYGKSETEVATEIEPTTIILTSKKMIFDNQTLLNRMEMTGSGKQWKLMNGIYGFWFDKKDIGEINIIFNNSLSVDSSIHLHGQTPSYLFDGVPYLSSPPISPGRIAAISFLPKESGYPNEMGTHFMHSHYGFQTNLGLAAPFIIDSPVPTEHPLAEKANEAQDVLFFLQEACPILNGHPEMDCDHDQIFDYIRGVTLNKTGETIRTTYKYILANGKLLDDPYRLTITKKESTIRYGTTIRLRVINAASTSNFLISFGGLNATVLSVDGQLVQPLTQTSFWVGVAQRMDIIINFSTEGSYPIIATTGEVDTSSKSTAIWIDIATSKLKTEIPSVKAGLMLYKTEAKLKAYKSLPTVAAPNKIFRINITGENGFNSINHFSYKIFPFVSRPIYPNPNPLLVNYGDRVHIEILSFDGREHPFHLHGHHFQVIQIGEEPFNGAVRDTINVAPDQLVVIAFDAVHPGVWLLNSQSEWDLAAGMITTIEYF